MRKESLWKTKDNWFVNSRVGDAMIFFNIPSRGSEQTISGFDYIYVLIGIPGELGVPIFIPFLKGKSSLSICERHASLK